jgi:hypothetical protein
VTEQAQLVKDRVLVVAKAWVVVRVEAEWAGLSLRDQVEIVYARTAVQRFLILLDSLAIKEAVLNAVLK